MYSFFYFAVFILYFTKLMTIRKSSTNSVESYLISFSALVAKFLISEAVCDMQVTKGNEPDMNWTDELRMFVFVALRPMSIAMVIAGRPVHLTTLFPGQAWASG